MIGAFARMIGARDRVLTVDQNPERGVEVLTREDPVARSAAGEPPEAFVATLEEEYGKIHISPFIEALREAIHRRLQGMKAPGTVPSTRDNVE